MSQLRYPCLVLDHDDTVMDSTRHIHYPAFCLGMETLRPGVKISLEEFFLLNFRPGIHSFYRDVMKFDDAEYRYEYDVWQSYVGSHVPRAFPGWERILRRQREGGGLFFISSHSVKEQILRDFRENRLPPPDGVYGWELPPERRKPSPFALEEIMEHFDLRPEEILVLDDLRFGCEMARAAGTAAAGAGWAYDIPEIQQYMRGHCDFFFDSIRELEDFLFPES